MNGWRNLARWRGFGRLLIVAGKRFFRDNGPTWAAAIAYYSLLSIFPLLLAAGALAAYFVDPNWAVLRILDLLGDFLPKGEQEIEAVVRNTLKAARGAGVLFIVPLLWTGTLVFGAITQALNVAFEGRPRYSFLKRLLVRLLMLLSLGVVFVSALAASFLLRLLPGAAGFPGGGSGFIARAVIALAPVVLVFLAFFLAYRFVPARRPGSRAALLGAGIATAGFFAAKPLFVGYVHRLARQSMVYGSLAGIVAAVFWVWLVALIGLFGGQITARYQALLSKGGAFKVLPPP